MREPWKGNFSVANLWFACDNIDGDVANWIFDIHDSFRTYNWKTDKGSVYHGKYEEMPKDAADALIMRFKIHPNKRTIRVLIESDYIGEV